MFQAGDVVETDFEGFLKGHFTDCSELVNTVCEVVELPWICGKSLHDSFSGATVYEAVAA